MSIKSLSHLGRFKDIFSVLIRYGFHDLVERLDVPGVGLIDKAHKVDHGLGTYERIRRALEDLGPTFVKIGQVMSLRPDLLPAQLVEELTKLQDEVAPVEFSEIKQVVEESFGRPLQETFSTFETEPLAAASISQVHRAVLREDGRIVAVKVQRPGIRSKIEADLDILEDVAERIHEKAEDLRSHDLPNLVRLVRRTLLNELDFSREARNMKIALGLAGPDSAIHIPAVYAEHCTGRVLVMEFVRGRRTLDVEAGSLADPLSLARAGLHTAIKQILEDGFFHADPHPGNILITEDQRLCLLDWGMTGRLSERDRLELLDFLSAVLKRDGQAMVRALLRIGSAPERMDQRKLERELLDILDSHFSVPLKDLQMGRLLMALMDVLRAYRLGLPPDFVIMIKALVTAEGTARHLYPELNVVAEAEEHVSRLALSRFEPRALWRRFSYSLSDLYSLQQDLPRLAEQILKQTERGELSIGFRHENLGRLMNTLDNVSNRLTFGIIIASMIIGSSLIITTGVGPLLFGFPALGVAGYLISAIIGLWLVVNIIRKRNY